MNDILIVMIGYIISFLFGVGLLWFFMSDFMTAFLKVKASRGKLILVKLRSSVRDYYRVGKLDDEMLVFKDDNKNTRRINMHKAALYRTLNVNCVDIDEESNCMISRDYEVLNGHDAKKINNLFVRALTKPQTLSKTDQIIMFMLGAAILGILLTLFFVYNIMTGLDELALQAVSNVGEV